MNQIFKLIILSVGLIFILIQGRAYLENEMLLLSSVVEDDLFYYVQIAKQFSEGNFYTYDGTSHTNGFHPLFAWGLAIMMYLTTPEYVAENFFKLFWSMFGVSWVLLGSGGLSWAPPLL